MIKNIFGEYKMEYTINDLIQWVLLCATTLGAIYAGVSSRAALKQADAAKVQSAHAEKQSKSAYIQAESAVKSNQIALLEKRLHIYQGFNEIVIKMLQRSYSTMDESEDLWPFRSLVGISEFYYSSELHKLLEFNFGEIGALYINIDELKELREEGADEAVCRAKARECSQSKVALRKSIMASLDKMRDEIKAAA